MTDYGYGVEAPPPWRWAHPAHRGYSTGPHLCQQIVIDDWSYSRELTVDGDGVFHATLGHDTRSAAVVTDAERDALREARKRWEASQWCVRHTTCAGCPNAGECGGRPLPGVERGMREMLDEEASQCRPLREARKRREKAVSEVERHCNTASTCDGCPTVDSDCRLQRMGV